MSWQVFKDNILRYANNPDAIQDIDTVAKVYATEYDAAVKRGFDTDSARSTAIILLNQARVDAVNVFTLLDSLKGLTDVQLGQVVAQILNSYREKTSILGYHISTIADTYESRNILV